MSDQIKELAEIPQEFLRDGTAFLKRCTKPDKREFIKISQAVGVGFVVMGTIGYFVKLIHIPVNNILVGGA
ncbi:MAG: Sec61p translocation complex subunit [Vezdaea aestivalis]|nr:MAG: Sec61p translocation complex subunit [Vezdaea aestivalis]